VDDSMNFPANADWPATLMALDESQTELLNRIEKLDATKLQDIVPHEGYKYTFYTLIHGIIHHDIYHIGQVSLIKKALTVKS
jgi:uncharacterized damage-inducible protein DinB